MKIRYGLTGLQFCQNFVEKVKRIFDSMGLFNPSEKIPAVYCEGFPRNNVYGSYEQNHSQFTIELSSNYDVYTFIFLLKNYLGIKKED